MKKDGKTYWIQWCHAMLYKWASCTIESISVIDKPYFIGLSNVITTSKYVHESIYGAAAGPRHFGWNFPCHVEQIPGYPKEEKTMWFNKSTKWKARHNKNQGCSKHSKVQLCQRGKSVETEREYGNIYIKYILN